MWYSSIRNTALLAVTPLAGCIAADDQFGRIWSGADNSQSTIEVTMPSNAPSMTNIYYQAPARGPKTGQEHLGIDITATAGEPVIAPANGTVVSVFTEPFYGNIIIIDHGVNDDGVRVHTQYKHLQKQLVEVGDAIVRGQQIGTLGNTGILAGGINHLHFEIQLAGKFRRMEPVDPNAYWFDGRGIVTCFDASLNYPDKPFATTYPVECK